MSSPCFSICPKVCILGDSTGVNHKYYLAQYHYARINNLSTAGETPIQQKDRWDALSAEVKASFDYVFIQVGINQINGYNWITQYQELVDDINATKNQDCRVYGVTMTPIRGEASLDPSGYNNWLALNAAIRGEGATPITGLYGFVSGHTTAMGDANNYLLAEYDSGDHLHPNAAGNSLNCQYISEVMI